MQVVKKLARAGLVLVLVSVLSACMLDLAPGDPAYAILGDDASPAAIAKVHHDLQLDRPWVARYGSWFTGVLHGDFGRSYRANLEEDAQPTVTSLIMESVPVTLELVGLTMLAAILLSVPIATLAAYRAATAGRKGSRFDRFVTALSSLLVASPAFVTIPFLVFFLVLKVPLFPATGWVPITENLWENLRHVALPAFALSLVLVPHFIAALRDELIATLSEDYVLAARAKGLAPLPLVLRHALRPSSFLIITMSGLSLGAMISGSVIAESLFALPGLGTLVVRSIQSRDVETVQGVVMFIAMVYVFVNAAIDVGLGYLDPRVRLGSV